MNKQEEILQAECYKWFHNNFHDYRQMLFHVDNNSWNAIIGARKKALGVVSGVSDLIFVGQEGKVIFIEMKIPGGEQSEEQREFQKKVEMRGHKYVIVYYFEDFKNLILKQILGYGTL